MEPLSKESMDAIMNLSEVAQDLKKKKKDKKKKKKTGEEACMEIKDELKQAAAAGEMA
jgi:hypothetical protein